jgi:MFS family permease
MFDQTQLDVVTGGWLATINYVGYMTGALAASLIGSLVIKDNLYRAGLLLTVLATMMMGLGDSLWVWGVSRYIAGFATAAGLLMGSGLLLNWLLRNGHKSEMGIHFGGVGLGIVLVSLLVGGLAEALTWSQLWLLLAAVGVVLAVPAWQWLPRPDTSGLTHQGKVLKDQPPSSRFLWLMMFVYFCAGFGFVISATYIVAIVEGQSSTHGGGDLAFLLLGLSAIPACLVWDRVTRKLGILKALMLAFLLHAIGIILPALSELSLFGYLSAVLYGFTFIGIVSIVLTMAGRFYPTKPAKLMGSLTVSYGVPQIVAPTIAGYLAQASGNYYEALYLAAGFVMLGLCAIVAIQLWASEDIKKLA